MKYILPILLLTFIFSSCGKSRLSEDELIAEFIAENNLEGEFMTDGIFVSIENPGNGEHPDIDDTVEVYYEGQYVSDGQRFDGNLNDANPISFPLTAVIPGWTKGIPYFGVGEKGWLILPAKEAYGSLPPPGVRNNAAMAFYVELVAIQ